jgi:hypothetical protein
MARLPWFEQMADQLDRSMLRIRDDLDTRLRIARRAAKWRELQQLERLDQLAEAQQTLPLALPEQANPATANDPPPQGGKRSRGPALRTQRWFGAAFAYLDSGEAYEDNMHPGELARRIADFAVKHDLDGARELSDVAGDSTSRDLMTAGLAGIRRLRGR